MLLRYPLLVCIFLLTRTREDIRLQREAQAEVIRRLALERKNEGYKVIVTGDFNDYDGDENSKDHINSTLSLLYSK
jgi:hypothetical protein